MNTQPLTVGRYVAQLLVKNGIDTVFGIPGVHTLELYRELATSGLRHVLVRHEQAAGFAADGYARATGRAAAVFVISGPGVTNVLTAVAQAYSDSVPMLVVASTPVRASLGQSWGVLHELPSQQALVAALLGAAGSARGAQDVRDCLRAAFIRMRAPRARPAYVEIPLDLLGETTGLVAERFDAAPFEPGAADIGRALALLETAERPLIIAGGGAKSAAAALRELVQALDTFLVTTVAGKGILAEDHPANLGASLPYADIQELVAQADVVLAIGTELAETDVYTAIKLPMSAAIIRIDVDPVKLCDHYAAEVTIHADAKLAVAAIAKALRARTGWRTRLGNAAAHRARLEARFDPKTKARLRALAALRAALPADAVVFSDMTQIAYLGNYGFAADRPGAWFHPSGYGTLGYALPAAIGAKIAAPERAVMALAGDFGLQFTLHELMTAVELGLTLPIVVWNNAALGQIRDDMVAADMPPVAVAARNPDFLTLARACGAMGVRAANPAALADALRAALKHPGPTLIEASESEFLAGAPMG